MLQRRQSAILCMALAVLPALAGCSTPRPAAELAAPVSGGEYILGAGDTLSVFVHRAPELSAELPIRPDGRVSLPLVPDIQAAGRTSSALAANIQERLRTYVREPSVTVMVRSFQGPPDRQIRVIGEAAMPMATPYRDGMTVLDVMINARGLTRYAAGNRASIIRRNAPDEPPVTIPVRLTDLLRNGDMTQDVMMRPGDTLIIPQGWF